MKSKGICPECKKVVWRGGVIHYGNHWHKVCFEKSQDRHRPFGVGLTRRQQTIRAKKYRAKHPRKK